MKKTIAKRYLWKKILALSLAGAMIISFAGCSSQSKEDIMKQTVATVEKEEIKKEELDKLVGVTLVSYYATQKTEVPSSDDSVANLRKNILDNMIEMRLSQYTENKYPVKVNNKEIEKETKSTIKTIKESLGEKEYLRILDVYGFGSDSKGGTGTSKNNKSLTEDNTSKNNTDSKSADESNDKNSKSKDGVPEGAEQGGISAEEDFESAVKDFVTLSYKLNAFENSFKNKEKGSGDYSKNAFAKVDGKEIPSYIFYYYMIQKEFEISSSGQSVSTDEEIDKLNKDAMENAEICQLYINKGKADGIKVTDKELKAKLENMDVIESYYGASSIKMLCDAYGITEAQYKAAKKWVATGDVYMEKVIAENVSKVEVSESEAKREFDNNKKNYESGTVSAKHILTSDKSLANEILKKAKSSGDGFDQVMAEYQNREGVTAAEDVGAFSRGQMVEDFENAAFDAKKGDVIGPIKTEYGYHVIYVYDVNKGAEPNFEEYKEQIIQGLKAEKQTNAEDRYTEQLKKKAKIEELRDMKNPFNMLIDEIKKEHPVKINDKVVDK